ncbi:MAG: 50S ribosomal protein L29 [Planctomycetes bacterium]|nr:50S ribosomal protein L29 [Planctomycetota bacterium]
MKIAEVRQKSNDELKTEVKKIHEEHFNLRFRRVTDVIENPQALRDLRRTLARIQTVMRQREMEEAQKAPAKPAAAPVKAEKAKKPGKTKTAKAAKPAKPAKAAAAPAKAPSAPAAKK